MGGSGSNDKAAKRTARREFLALSGTAGIAALAGCSGEAPETGSNGSGTGGTGSGNNSSINGSSSVGDRGSDLMDNSFTAPGRYVPTNMQWNSYAPSHYSQVGSKVVFEPFLRYNRNTGEIIPYLFRDWTKDGKKLTVSVREDGKWHNGDDETAQDYVTKFKIDQLFGYEIGDYIDNATAVDDTTIEYTLASNYREDLILTVLSGSWLDTPTSRYGKFAKRADNASSDKERQEVQSAVQDFQPSEPLGSGPFQFKSASQQSVILEKVNDHPIADQIKFPYYEVAYSASNQQQWAAMKNKGGLDTTTTTFIPKDIRQSLPDSVREYRFPSYNGYSIAFNHDDEDFGKRKVRQAIAHVLDQKKMANLADATKTAVDVPMGVGSFHSGTWKDSLPNPEMFSKYQNADKATQLLESEGYTKNGGNWKKPNGDQFTLEIPTPSGWSDFVSFGTTVAQMLTDFGIQTQSRNVENTTFFGQYWGSSNFKIAPWFWNNSGKTSPFFSLSWILNSGTVKTNLNYPQKPKAPAVGKPNANATSTNIAKLLRNLGSTTEASKQKQLTQQLAWVTNQSLPMIPLIEKQSQTFMKSREWNIPPEDTEAKYVPIAYYWYPRISAVTPKQE